MWVPLAFEARDADVNMERGYSTMQDLTSDGGNTYLYDAEGRICAFATPNGLGGTIMMGYIYNAEGSRVAKGTITTMTCDPATNGFTMTGNNTGTYVLGQGSEELTQLSGSGIWQRTNVYGGGRQLATYDLESSPELHFQLTDPLGTRRMQTDAYGRPETDIQSLPYGDGLSPAPDQYAPATADDATPLHFTGKERDAESGNDYFLARYYGSSMGRFLSPDPGPFVWHDPQTLNRYAYTRNNPLKFVDPTGMYFVIAPGNEQARQAISMLLRSQTGRALVGSIAADPRPTYVGEGKLPANMFKGQYTVGTHQVNEANEGGNAVMTGTTVTISSINALLAGVAGDKSLFYMLLKAYAHELSHVADANAAPDFMAAIKAACMGDGNNCNFNGGDTTHGTAEALALQIMAELGDPGAYTPDAASDAEASGIIDQGNGQENGTPPWAPRNGNSQNPFGNPAEEDAQRQCALGNPAACN
jgi:RHS repeat-associated protein